MALQVKINGVDYSDIVQYNSIAWEQNLTDEVDTFRFQINKFGSRTFVPAVAQLVEVYQNSVKIFAGIIVEVNSDALGSMNIYYQVTVKDLTHLFDQRLVIEDYKNKPVINIIADIITRYANKNDHIEVSNFQTTENWVGGTADLVNFRNGSQGLKLTSSGSPVSAQRSVYLDLQPAGFGSDDIIEIDLFVEGWDNISTAELRLGNVAMTAYFSTNFTLVNGWNYVRIPKASFNVTGSPVWTNIGLLKLIVEADAPGGSITFSNWQLVKATAFTRINANTATQVVNQIAFKYEQPSQCIKQLAELFNWNWYIDENKDLHFFDKFAEPASFNLDDTSGNFVYNSLQIQNNIDQLRNSIFIRGGDALGSTVTENLSQQADGNNKVFLLGYKYANYTLTIDGTQKAVGVANLQQFLNNNSAIQSQKGTASLNLGDLSANTQLFQQVICTAHGRRGTITLRMKKVGLPVDNVQVQIFNNNAGIPGATAKSTVVTLAGSSIGSSDFNEYNFALTESTTNSLLFNPDDKYSVVISRSGAVDASNYYILDGAAEVYDGTFGKYDGAVWTTAANDLYFIEKLSFDALFNFNEKNITFSAAPAGGTSIIWTAQPYYPVIVQYKDNISIQANGEYQAKIIDKTILTKEAAKQRGLAEVKQWANATSEIKFTTNKAGLRAGQTINVNSVVRGLDEDYVIKRVTAKCRDNQTFQYEIDGMTTRSYGIIYWLQQQIKNTDKQIDIAYDEQSDKIDSFESSFSASGEYTQTLRTGFPLDDDAHTIPGALVLDSGEILV